MVTSGLAGEPTCGAEASTASIWHLSPISVWVPFLSIILNHTLVSFDVAHFLHHLGQQVLPIVLYALSNYPTTLYTHPHELARFGFGFGCFGSWLGRGLSHSLSVGTIHV